MIIGEVRVGVLRKKLEASLGNWFKSGIRWVSEHLIVLR